MYLITKWFGTFLFNKNGVKKEILFPKDEDEIVKRLNKIENKEIIFEEKQISKNIKDIIVNEKRLIKIGNYQPNDIIFKKIDIQPETFNFSNELLVKATIKMTKNNVQKDLSSMDLQVVQMVNALDDLIQTSNLLQERMDTWSILPNYNDKIEPIENVLINVKKEIKNLEMQIDSDMQKIAPNITKIIGALIGARLISHAGRLDKLATMPASTVQILGAEKALFRFKKEGGKPPKHGVIYQHPYLSRNPKKFSGKISRLLSTKIAIASKADAFTKRDISEELMKDIEKRIKNIKKE